MASRCFSRGRPRAQPLCQALRPSPPSIRSLSSRRLPRLHPLLPQPRPWAAGLGIQPTEIPPPHGPVGLHTSRRYTSLTTGSAHRATAPTRRTSRTSSTIPTPSPTGDRRSGHSWDDHDRTVDRERGELDREYPVLGDPESGRGPGSTQSQRIRLLGEGNLLDRVGHIETSTQGTSLRRHRATVHRQGPFPGQPTFLQLQYSQLSILIFNGVVWPHSTSPP